MPTFPTTEETPLLRLDFSDESAWESVCEEVTAPVPFNEHVNFQANVSLIDDPDLAGFSIEEIAALVPEDTHALVLAVDADTIADEEHPVICIDLVESPGQYFRFIPALSWAIENNLSLANADFEDFASLCDPDGILRKIPTGPDG